MYHVPLSLSASLPPLSLSILPPLSPCTIPSPSLSILSPTVPSAQKERLLCEEEDSRDSGSLVYCGYCYNHYKKMVQYMYLVYISFLYQSHIPLVYTVWYVAHIIMSQFVFVIVDNSKINVISCDVFLCSCKSAECIYHATSLFCSSDSEEAQTELT